ncbi:unnamed protein product [Anisakis simplex]|uniref:Uncharacterized protein n=1 Tax=Anisakis simplex TaxID=6269 RepID=A0A3P6P1R7_ANISI|nr:unnamed protein product [Anisakis simplex]
MILLDKSDETTILRDHSFSSVRLEYVESNFERVRAQVAADKKADVQRERQQLLGEIDEEMKLRRKELEQSQQRITISHETPQRTEESEKVHELEVELDNLQTLSASFSITSNRIVEEITFEVESVDRKEQLMALQSEVDRANFILCRFQKENIVNFLFSPSTICLNRNIFDYLIRRLTAIDMFNNVFNPFYLF